MKNIRADVRLVEAGLAASREKARSLIMAGLVYQGEVRIEKAGENVKEDAVLTVREDPNPYVSRGGLKLDKAIKIWDIKLNGFVCADVGASTGGFTDCMLKNGASEVYAIDVGYGQLDWSLRSDERVKVMERTNARNLTPDMFETLWDFVGMDVSFISVKLILPSLKLCMKENAEGVILIKPQFEAGREKVGKNGVVRDKQVHYDVICNVASFAEEIGFCIKSLDFSPITGPKGNIEFLLYLKNCTDVSGFNIEEKAREIVEKAHSNLV